MLEQPAAAEPALNARQHARLRGSFEHPIGGGQRFQVAGLAQVAMENLDAQAPEPQPVALRPRPPLQKGLRYGAADESTDARDQESHQTASVSRRTQLPEISWKIAGKGLVISQAG
jgi:hypothetical protein